MDWAQIIVVLLAVCLIIFVIVAVLLVVMVVRLGLQIRSLMRSAQAITDNVTHAMNEVSAITKAVAIFQALRLKIKKRTRRKGE